MPTLRIKISYKPPISGASALAAVGAVIEQGRISESQHGPAYCAVSAFRQPSGDEIQVMASRSRTLDIFRVQLAAEEDSS